MPVLLAELAAKLASLTADFEAAKALLGFHGEVCAAARGEADADAVLQSVGAAQSEVTPPAALAYAGNRGMAAIGMAAIGMKVAAAQQEPGADTVPHIVDTAHDVGMHDTGPAVWVTLPPKPRVLGRPADLPTPSVHLVPAAELSAMPPLPFGDRGNVAQHWSNFAAKQTKAGWRCGQCRLVFAQRCCLCDGDDRQPGDN